MCLITTFKKELIKYLTRSSDDSNFNKCENLIKLELSASFEFSFKISLKEIWENYVKLEGNCEEFENNIIIYGAKSSKDENEAIENLINESNSWILKIQKVKIESGFCQLQLERKICVKKLCEEINSDDYCRNSNFEGKSIFIDIEKDSTITQFRLEIIKKVLENLLQFSKCKVVTNISTSAHNIILSTKKNKQTCDELNFHVIRCGVVENWRNTPENYIKKRQEDLHLIAIHKYGIRVERHKVI